MKYCPKCRTEYEDWVRLCADCKVPLVINLPPEKKPESAPIVNYVKIHTTPNSTDIAFFKSVLDGNKIQYFIKNEGINQTFSPMYLDGSAWMDIMVVEDKADEARELLKDYIEKKPKSAHPSNSFGWHMLWVIYFWFFALMFALPTILHIVSSQTKNNWEIFNTLVNILSYIGLFLYAYKKRKFNAIFWKAFFVILIVWDFFAYDFVNNWPNCLTLVFQNSREFTFFVLNLPLYIALYLYAFHFFNQAPDDKRNKK